MWSDDKTKKKRSGLLGERVNCGKVNIWEKLLEDKDLAKFVMLTQVSAILMIRVISLSGIREGWG